MSHGLKSIAKELHKHGRYGDSIVAHINPQEAALLKAMGGSGTINPTTGLPEYWGGLGALNPVKAVSNAWGGISKLPGISAIDKGLVGIDKAVGKTIPGGWGTLGMAAASFVPGMTPLMMAGLGALNGSGVARGGKFNLQGAIMGGAMAYGMSNLSSALPSAGGSALPSGAIEAANASGDAIGSLDASQMWTGPDAIAANTPAFDPSNTNFAYTPSGEMVPSNVPSDITGAAQAAAPTPSPLQNFAEGYGRNVSAAGRGLTNLAGFGADGSAAAARAAFEGSGASLQNTALPIVAGGMGLAAADEQQDSGTVNDADYTAQMARINAGKERAKQAVNENPYQFAMGGAINTPDDQTGLPSQTPMQNFQPGNGMNYANGGSIPGYAGGRFLSGGGDGLSDDIPAVIGGKQPARLADGEFVISSDVVSNLGNGSSKAGAKKLYAMMDRVRQHAHGSKKQIRKVNANKVLPA